MGPTSNIQVAHTDAFSGHNLSPVVPVQRSHRDGPGISQWPSSSSCEGGEGTVH